MWRNVYYIEFISLIVSSRFEIVADFATAMILWIYITLMGLIYASAFRSEDSVAMCISRNRESLRKNASVICA